MVVITNKEDTRTVSKAAQVAGSPSNQHEFDPPPSYTSAAGDIPDNTLRNRDLPPTPLDSLPPPLTPTTPSSSTQPGFSRSLPKPTNYFYLSESHKSIKGSYAVDPFLALPLTLLPALRAGEPESSRKHLKWTVMHGHVAADVTVVGRELPLGSEGEVDVSLGEERKRVDMEVGTTHGNVDFTLRTTGRLPPLRLSVICKHGTMSVAIPRTFQGLLRVDGGTHSKFHMSDELWAACTSLGQVHGTGRWFVGDVAALIEMQGQGQVETQLEQDEQASEPPASDNSHDDEDDADGGAEHSEKEDDTQTVTDEARGRRSHDEHSNSRRGSWRGSGRGRHRGRGIGRGDDRGGHRGGPGGGGRGRGRWKRDDRSRSKSNSRSGVDANSRSRSRSRSREGLKMTPGSKARKGASDDAKGGNSGAEEKDDWTDDEVSLHGKHARIWIGFEDEKMLSKKDKGREKEKEKAGEKKEGFFGRIFSRTKSDKQG